MAIHQFIAMYVGDPVDIRVLRGRLDADPVHRAQAETHARTLRELGIVVSNELVEAVLEGLG